MAHKYVRSAAAGAGTGADWANAYTTLAAGLTGSAVGDNIWVAGDHAETQASAMTLTAPGTAASPNTVICVNHAGSVPPVAADILATATVSTTGSNALTLAGSNAYWEGIIFNAGSGVTTSNLNLFTSGSVWAYFKNCAFRKLGTGSAVNAIVVGIGAVGGTQRIIWDNCTVQFGHIGDGIAVRGADFWWKNTPSSTITGAILPTILFTNSSNAGPTALIEGVDLSALGSGKTLVGAVTASKPYVFKDCKIDAAVTRMATSVGPGGAETLLVRTAAAGNHNVEKHAYTGALTTETTIVRTGGASDGTTPIAWKIVTTANAKPILPFHCPPIAVWNDVEDSAVTVTVEGIWGGGSVPNNNDIWLDVEYIGDGTAPLGAQATGGLATVLTTATALAAGSGTWGGSTTKFKLTATFTPAQKGFITLYINAGAASSTFYIDPKVTLS